MAPNDKNLTADNLTLTGVGVNKAQNMASVNTQDQTLLKALQDLIVRVMDPKQNKDINKIHLGPEAGKLITALQEFISSIVVRSQSGARHTTVDVSLTEEELREADLKDNKQEDTLDPLEDEKDLQDYVSHLYNDDDDEHHKWYFAGQSFEGSAGSGSESEEIMNNSSEHLDAFVKPQPTFEERILAALREHVFNMMPMRLLCFEPRGLSLQITLLERSAIHAHIESALKADLNEELLRPQTLAWEKRLETEQSIIERLISKYAGYVILSHTWLRTTSGSEVTYADWNNGLLDSKSPGYQKLVNFCKTAWKHHRLTLGWMDTVCINKESSSELDESIRSMYSWYKGASVCVVYLAGTDTLSNMHLDPWFTRGWTLQELLAPRTLKFYNNRWNQLVDNDNDKYCLETLKAIGRATTITSDELSYIYAAPMSRRMQLAASREVTRVEDTAYSLMGIFDVSISIAYGEGAARAFLRLLQEILVSSKNVLEILNWAGELPFIWAHNSHILPASPKNYINCSSSDQLRREIMSPTEPLILTHLGLRVPVILMPGISVRDKDPLQDVDPIGDYYATVYFSEAGRIPTTYNLLDKNIFGAGHPKDDDNRYQITFAVFNFSGGGPNIIHLPETCIAFGLRCREPVGKVSSVGHIHTLRTQEPIVFELNRKTTAQQTTLHGNRFECNEIKPDELAKHGMQHITLYL